jgi:hypothetical protein
VKVVVLAVAAAVLGIAGCGNIQPLSKAKCAAPASSKPAPSPSNSLSGPVGMAYQVPGLTGQMSIILTKVIDPAQAAGQVTTPASGCRFVGAVFTITGISGTLSADANHEATLIGSNGQIYTADSHSIAGYTNFSNGEYTVRTGEKSVGAVTFQVPLTVKVAKIEWSDRGFGAPAEWLVSAKARTGPWVVVKAYYHDITVRDYAAAWRLLGHRSHGVAYATFVAGYAHTGRQIVRKLSQSGDQVSFTLRSENPDGTVQTYRGTDTVIGAKIVHFKLVQTGGPAAA